MSPTDVITDMKNTVARLIFRRTELITPLIQSLIRPRFYKTTRTCSTRAVGITTIPLTARKTIDTVTRVQTRLTVTTVPRPITPEQCNAKVGDLIAYFKH